MNKSVIILVIAAVVCCVSLGEVFAGSGNQVGSDGESWAEQRADIELSIKVSPQTINFDSQANGDWVTVHTDIPYAYVDVGTLALNGVPAAYAFADDRGCLVAKFSLAEILAIVAPPSAELTLTGSTDDGEPFAGSDIVKVLDPLA